MRPRSLRLLQALVVVGAMAFLIAVILRGGGERDEAARRAGFELVPYLPGGPAGVAFLERSGDRLRGTVVAWGLTAGTRHYGALRGPGARCVGPPGAVDAELPSLVADENGVAFGRVDVPAPATALGGGLALTINSDASPRSNPVTCGTADAAARLTPAQLSALGGRRTGAPGAAVSALVQLEGGRPVGDPGVQLIRARRGDRVALALRADEPDELRLGGYGLIVQVGPGTIARLSFIARRTGSFPLRGATTGRRPVARLVVEP